MSDYVSQRDAEERLGISRTLFEERLRPQLTAYPLGVRAIRYEWREIEELVAESAATQEEQDAVMLFRRTVSDALDHAWRIKWSKAKGAHKKAQLVKVVRRDVGDLRLGKIDYDAIEAWVERMNASEQAVATIKSKVSCLVTALKLVKPKGWVKVIPDIPPLGDPDNAKLRWLTEDEEKALIAACNCLRRYVVAEVMQDVVAFLIDTGARVSELTKVRDDSLATRGTLTYVEFLDRKASDDLRIPLTKRADEAIRRLLKNRFWLKRIRGTRESAKRLASAQNWLTHKFAEVRDAAKLPERLASYPAPYLRLETRAARRVDLQGAEVARTLRHSADRALFALRTGVLR